MIKSPMKSYGFLYTMIQNPMNSYGVWGRSIFSSYRMSLPTSKYGDRLPEGAVDGETETRIPADLPRTAAPCWEGARAHRGPPGASRQHRLANITELVLFGDGQLRWDFMEAFFKIGKTYFVVISLFFSIFYLILFCFLFLLFTCFIFFEQKITFNFQCFEIL